MFMPFLGVTLLIIKTISFTFVPKVIERLKREIQQLKDELAMANGTEYDEELTQEIRKR